MRTLVIGDIHGAYKCLLDVLEKAGPADHIIFLGDYTDGLPESFEVVEHIRNMKNAICIRGNHDQWTIDWMKACRNSSNYRTLPSRSHYDQGGKSTYDSYMSRLHLQHAIEEHLDFLDRTVPHFLDEAGRAFTHGGFGYLGLGDSNHEKMWNRELLEHAYRLEMGWKRSGKPKAGIPPPYDIYPEIFVGHTATKFLTGKEEVANWVNLWAMDTNCGWGGPLCAMDVDTKECFYSKPAREFYPDYKGR